MIVQHDHIIRVITSMCKEMGKEVPDFQSMSIETLSLKYQALVEEANCIPFTEEEFENLYYAELRYVS
jgi:hypothetical protein